MGFTILVAQVFLKVVDVGVDIDVSNGVHLHAIIEWVRTFVRFQAQTVRSI